MEGNQPEKLKDESADLEAGGVRYEILTSSYDLETPITRASVLPRPELYFKDHRAPLKFTEGTSTNQGDREIQATSKGLPQQPSEFPEVTSTDRGGRGTNVTSKGESVTGGGSDQPLRPAYPPRMATAPRPVQMIFPTIDQGPKPQQKINPGFQEGTSTNQVHSGIKASDGRPGGAEPQRKVPSLSLYLQNQLQSLENTVEEKESGIKPKIQKVHPRLLKKQNFEKYYRPVALPFGPIHQEDSELKEAGKLKLNLASHFIKQNLVDKEELCKEILMKIEDLKECYDEDLLNGYHDGELAWSFLVDGCAVLGFIQCLVVEGEVGKKIFFRYDKLEGLNIKIDIIPYILRDLFLLENQLPYQLLLLICSATSIGVSLIRSIKSLVAERARADQLPSEEHIKGEPSHLLDLLRDFLIVEPGKLLENSQSPDIKKPKMTCTWGSFKFCCRRRRPYSEEPDAHVAVPYSAALPNLGITGTNKEKPHMRLGKNKKEASQYDQHTFRNVTELKASGVGFKRSETNSLKAIDFQPGWFLGDVRLPLLTISDDSAPIFLNLVAYEMCPDFKNEYEVTSYLCFMDSLIDRPEDVAELRKQKILRNHFGSDEEVAKLFNEIGTDLVPNPILYVNVTQEIDGVYRNKWKVWLAQFLNDHFSSPWTVLVFLGAIFGLLMTFLQTWFSVFSPKDC